MKATMEYSPEAGDRITHNGRWGTIRGFMQHCSNCDKRMKIHWDDTSLCDWDDIELSYLGNWNTAQEVWTLDSSYDEDHKDPFQGDDQ